MATKLTIDNAVANYAQRQTRQQVKRLLHQAERLNGDRLAKLTGAGQALRKVLDDLNAIAPGKARAFASSIGWGDKYPA